MVAEKANFNVSAGSIDGPYALAGGAVVNDARLKIDLAVSAKSAAGYAVDVALEAGGGKASFKGSLDELSPRRGYRAEHRPRRTTWWLLPRR